MFAEEQERVLLCEDDAALGSLLADYLRRLNYEVTLCNNGEDGWDAFRQRQYDICLLDINMPEKNGFELLEAISNMGSEKPVLFVTERKAREEIVKG